MLMTITPFLNVRNARAAVDFYVAGFGATVSGLHDTEGERLTCQVEIGEARFWVGDEEPEYSNLSPQSGGGNSIRMIIETEDADVLYERAIRAGAVEICPMTTEEEWRIGKLRDPFGRVWEIGHMLSEKQ